MPPEPFPWPKGCWDTRFQLKPGSTWISTREQERSFPLLIVRNKDLRVYAIFAGYRARTSHRPYYGLTLPKLRSSIVGAMACPRPVALRMLKGRISVHASFM